jgi:hypothetical protein
MRSPLNEPVEVSDCPLLPLHNRVLIVVFLFLLGFPSIKLASELPGTKPGTKPPFSLTLGTFTQWRKYLVENFGGRAQLIRMNAELRANVLGVSTNPKVLVGRSGWLYLADEYGVEDIRHQMPFSEQELRAWGDYLTGIDRWAKKRGIPFLLIFTLNKQTVYPEYLPGWVTKVGPASRLDQLKTYLKEHADITTIDPRETLSAGKHEQLYYKTDSHWNDLGMILAAEPITRQLQAWFPKVQVSSLADFEVTHSPTSGGDLARMLASRDLRADERVKLIPRTPRRAVLSDPRELSGLDVPYLEFLFSQREGAPIGRAVVYRDSFLNPMIAILAESLGRGVFVWGAGVDYTLLEREHPDVVILQMIERRLYQPVPRALPPE